MIRRLKYWLTVLLLHFYIEGVLSERAVRRVAWAAKLKGF